MSVPTTKIKNIIRFNDFVKDPIEFTHLFEVQVPPDDINLWKIRYNFDMGTPLVGDLLLNLESERNLEIHPFPEWVVYLKSIGNKSSRPYLVVPNFPKSFIKKISRKSIDEKVNLIKNQVDNIQIDDLIAFEYEVGINILVPAFIPHFFISSHIDKDAGETPPYLQVFEPKLDTLTTNLRIKTTYFFKLPYTVRI